MKDFKKIITIGAVVLTIGVTSITALAVSSYKTPAEAVAGITGRDVQSVIEDRANTGKAYGKIASDAGKLDKFKEEMIQIKEDKLAELVAKGTITQEKADEIMAQLQANKENCDGTGKSKVGRNNGVKFGANGEGCRNGSGKNKGDGSGKGIGGMRMQKGSCNVEVN